MTRPERADAPEPARRAAGADVPSAEVLDELLRAFAADAADASALQHIDLDQSRGRRAARTGGRSDPRPEVEVEVEVELSRR